MRIAIPVTDGRLSPHFGHCEQFAIIDTFGNSKNIQSEEVVTTPPHQPGVLPEWLSGLNVELVIASGIGRRAQQLFRQNNIDVVVGAPHNTPKELVMQYLTGQMRCGQNVCDH
jgi:predicted Fe-Mo cluster-binding NifX family protein